MEGAGRHVEVAVVAPVGVEQSAGAEFFSGAGVLRQNEARFLDGVEDRAEAAHGGADGRGPSARDELAAFFEFVRGEIGPVEDFATGGQVGNCCGMLEEHVAPEHEGFAVAGGFLLEEPDVVDVLARDFAGAGIGHALAEVVGLVAAEIEAGRRKTRQEFIEDAAEQILRAGIAGVDGGAAEALEPGGGFPRRGREFDFGQIAVLRKRQNAAEVAEAGEGGDEFDEMLAAKRVEVFQILGTVGVVVAGDGGVELETERVFEIELEVVDFEGSQQVDAAFQHVAAGNAAAADVEIIAAQGEDGGVGDFEAGKGGAGLPENLAESLESVEEAGGVGGGDAEAIRLD